MLAHRPGLALVVAVVVAVDAAQHPVEHRPAPVVLEVPIAGAPAQPAGTGVEVRAGDVVGYPGFQAQGADLSGLIRGGTIQFKQLFFLPCHKRISVVYSMYHLIQLEGVVVDVEESGPRILAANQA